MKPLTKALDELPEAADLRPHLLIVEDDPGLRRQLRWLFEDFQVHTAADRDSALKQISRHPPAVVVLDLGLPPDPGGATEGLALLDPLLQQDPNCQILVLTGHGDTASALEAVSQGACDFLHKPLAPDRLAFLVSQAWLRYRLLHAHRHHRLPSPAAPELLGHSKAMQRVHRQLQALAPAPPSFGILIQGETGTGKELAARALHRLSGRDGPFVAVNVTTAESLKESELFGHEKGAFTGAERRRLGAFERADGGTLFLDEIGDMPLSLQPKLLRVLQEREVQRLGGDRPISVDVRIVCATHHDLHRLTTEGKFRQDLYYRLCGDVIHLPPLRERPEDIPLLAHAVLGEAARAWGKPVRSFSPAALDALENHPWPGNVRELQNVVHRGVSRCRGPRIEAEDLGLETKSAAPESPSTLAAALRRTERRMLARALAQSGGRIAGMARALGVSRPTVYRLLREHDLTPTDPKVDPTQ